VAVQRLTAAPLAALLIAETQLSQEHKALLRLAKQNATEWLVLEFDDVNFPFKKSRLATEDDIRRGLDFATGKSEMVVSCHAGVSRSSAMAYAILRSRGVSAQEAASNLNIDVHHPNALVLPLAGKIIGKPLVDEVVTHLNYPAEREMRDRESIAWAIM